MNVNNNNNKAPKGSYGPRKGDFFQIPGTFQPILSPRFSNVDYGAMIRYNRPCNQFLGVPPNNPYSYNDPQLLRYKPKK